MAIVLSVSTFAAHAEIVSATTMKDVQAKIEVVLESHKAEDVLAAFDIDMTLTHHDHPAVYYPALKKYVDIYKTILGKLSPVQKDIVHTLIVQTIPQKLVEEETPQILKALQAKGIRPIAFTAALTGKFSKYKDKTIFLRREQLQKNGFDFTMSFKDFTSCASYMDFPRYAGWYPMFYHGVLSSNGEGKISKGQTLIAFLKHVGLQYQQKVGKPGYYPKVIILIDDCRKNLVDVEENLKAYDPSIQFIGIEYQGAYSYAPQDISKEAFQKFWEGMAEKAKAEVY